MRAYLWPPPKRFIFADIFARDVPQTSLLTTAARSARPTGNDQDEYGFERGTRRRYALDVGHRLGTLRRVFVQQVRPHVVPAAIQ